MAADNTAIRVNLTLFSSRLLYIQNGIMKKLTCQILSPKAKSFPRVLCTQRIDAL